jgi:hypothetical protein
MDETLTFDEIKSRYAPDWVLIGDLDTDETLEIRSGRVLFHSPDREAVYEKAIELRPGRFACRYLGEWPEDLVFLL